MVLEAPLGSLLSPARRWGVLAPTLALLGALGCQTPRPAIRGPGPVPVGGDAEPGAPAWIDLFGGWAGPRGGTLYARVHRGPALALPQPAECSLVRLEQTLRDLELSAIPDAVVAVEGIPGVSQAHANGHGFIALSLPSGLAPGSRRVKLTLQTPGWQPASAVGALPVWDDLPGTGVISDIDDTLTDTGVTHKGHLLLGTFFHSEFEVKVFPGSAEAIRSLASWSGDAGSPLFYLSGSPWGFHRRIAGAFNLAGLPRAPMILRSYSTEPLDPFDFKWPHLEALVNAFPNRRWVLLGDSGEKDPEVYAALRAAHPDRVQRIYIHDVTGEDPGSARFQGMTVFNAWSELAPPSP